MYEKIKSNRGITLTALVVYLIIFTLLIGVMTTISTFFFGNIREIMYTPKYGAEFNKFAMFFVVDVKNYSEATISTNKIEFENGPTYQYLNNTIYRNDVAVAKQVLNCVFTAKQYNVNDVTKNLINVDIRIGSSEEKAITRNIDFTLRYW